MNRVITVIGTTLSTPREYNTSVTTWGQLKDLISRDFGDISNMQAVCKETRNTMDRDDAILHEGNSVYFLSSRKIKAGGINIVELLEALKMEYNEAIDNVIEQVNDGLFDVEPCHENAAGVSHVKGISTEDANFLRELQNS